MHESGRTPSVPLLRQFHAIGAEIDSQIIQPEFLGEHAVGPASRAADLKRANGAVRNPLTRLSHQAAQVTLAVRVQAARYRIEILQLLVELCRYLRAYVGSGRWLRQVPHHGFPAFGAPNLGQLQRAGVERSSRAIPRPRK